MPAKKKQPAQNVDASTGLADRPAPVMTQYNQKISQAQQLENWANISKLDAKTKILFEDDDFLTEVKAYAAQLKEMKTNEKEPKEIEKKYHNT